MFNKRKVPATYGSVRSRRCALCGLMSNYVGTGTRAVEVLRRHGKDVPQEARHRHLTVCTRCTIHGEFICSLPALLFCRHLANVSVSTQSDFGPHRVYPFLSVTT